MPIATDPSLPHPPVHGYTLGFLLREVYRRLQQRVYDKVAAAGHSSIRPMHSPVLRHLPAEGGRVSDIARETGLAKQSVAYVVEDLVELGYLRTEPDPDDGRALRLHYTARGHDLLGALVSASDEAENSLASVLGKDRLRSLRDMLQEALSQAPPSLPRSRSTSSASSGTRTRGSIRRQDGATALIDIGESHESSSFGTSALRSIRTTGMVPGQATQRWFAL